MNLAIILMTLFAALFVLVPVLRFRPSEKTEDREIRNQKNVEVFNQSINDLEADLSNELIDSTEFEKLKAELQRGFIKDMEDESTAKNPQSNTQTYKAVPLVLLVVLSIASFFFYLQVGSGRDLVIPDLLTQLQSATTEEEQIASLEELAAVLNSRFQRHADNIQFGYTLGGVYLNLEDYDDAARIFKQLADGMEESTDKATVLGQLAQSQYLLADSAMSPLVQETIDQALSMNPNEQAIMSLLAIDSLVNLRFAEAISYWRRQLIQLSPNSGEASVILERIARVEEMIPEDERTPVASGATVTIRVELDESLRDQIADDMRLFIFARGEDVPLPLAAQTFSVAELPLTITLDDSMAMTPQFTLSSAERVYVGARISRVATAQSGDFQAVSETFTVADQTELISLTIKDIVP